MEKEKCWAEAIDFCNKRYCTVLTERVCEKGECKFYATENDVVAARQRSLERRQYKELPLTEFDERWIRKVKEKDT